MKRRFAFKPNDNYKLLEIDETFFKGYACYLKLENIEKPLIVEKDSEKVCIKDNNYEWIEVYPKDGKYAITIMFDDKGNLIEWYFDISKEIGVENGIPYEDDLYLDLVIGPNCETWVLDEDDLMNAKDSGDISQDDVDLAYKTLSLLKEKYVNNFDELNKLTDYLLEKFDMNNIKKR
jgi:predicted RNA-binding protein associated with RNAse of E/G family